MHKWGSKMRPPFLNDFGKGAGGRGEPTRESYASQVPEESEGSCLLKNTPVPPLTGGGGFYRLTPLPPTSPWFVELMQ